MCTTNVGLISGLKVFLLVISCHVGFLGFFQKFVSGLLLFTGLSLWEFEYQKDDIRLLFVIVSL
jgi:hypothetical protein